MIMVYTGILEDESDWSCQQFGVGTTQGSTSLYKRHDLASCSHVLSLFFN